MAKEAFLIQFQVESCIMESITGSKRKVDDEDVQFIVGGVPYSLSAKKVSEHPDSELFRLWQESVKTLEASQPIVVERSGSIFQYVVGYILNNEYPSSKNLTMKRMQSICADAEYFKLPELLSDCRDHIIRKIKKKDPYRANVDCVYWAKDPNHLVNVLGQICAPFCVKGRWSVHQPEEHNHLYKSSTFKSLNIEELLADASQSAFGKETETLVDKNVRNSLEIPADRFDERAKSRTDAFADRIEYRLREFSPRYKLEVRPYKLVIYPEGGHFDEHRDSVRGSNHVGTVVLILPSEFTGGEFVVHHRGQEVSISEPFEFIALYGDCLHRVNKVLSGTRVCLLFDLYLKGVWPEESYKQDSHARFQHAGLERSVCDVQSRMRLVSALDKELEKYDDVVICLTHLYPLGQANPACLKGFDAELCAVIQDAAKYDVSIVPIAVNRTEDYKYSCSNDVDGYVVDLQYSESRGSSVHHFGRRKTELVIPVNVETSVVLHHKPYQYHVGNESVAEETMYLVTGLQVIKRCTGTEGPADQGDATIAASGSADLGESSSDGIDSDSNNSANGAWEEGSENSENSAGSEDMSDYPFNK